MRNKIVIILTSEFAEDSESLNSDNGSEGTSVSSVPKSKRARKSYARLYKEEYLMTLIKNNEKKEINKETSSLLTMQCALQSQILNHESSD